MRTEREPNRYEPLNETHRRVAEEQEKRRLAGQEQARSAPVDQEPEPQRPGTELDGEPGSTETQLADWQKELDEKFQRGEITRDEMIHSMRLFDAELRIDREFSDPRIPWPQRDSPGNRQGDVSAETEHGEQQSQGREPEAEPDSPEARYAAREKELEEKVQLGRINRSEMIYQLRQFDNQLSVERAQGGMPPPSPQRDSRQTELSAETERGRPLAPQQAEDTRDQVPDHNRDDPSQRVPETRIERDAAAAVYEITGRGEMSEARAARLERLRGIDHEIENESHENEEKGLDLDHDSGDRSR